MQAWFTAHNLMSEQAGKVSWVELKTIKKQLSGKNKLMITGKDSTMDIYFRINFHFCFLCFFHPNEGKNLLIEHVLKVHFYVEDYQTLYQEQSGSRNV